jgi:hypothetical protein
MSSTSVEPPFFTAGPLSTRTTSLPGMWQPFIALDRLGLRDAPLSWTKPARKTLDVKYTSVGPPFFTARPLSTRTTSLPGMWQPFIALDRLGPRDAPLSWMQTGRLGRTSSRRCGQALRRSSRQSCVQVPRRSQWSDSPALSSRQRRQWRWPFSSQSFLICRYSTYRPRPVSWHFSPQD